MTSIRGSGWLVIIGLLIPAVAVAYWSLAVWSFVMAWFFCAVVAGVALGLQQGYEASMKRAVWLALVPWAALVAVALFDSPTGGVLETVVHPGALLPLVVSYAGVALGVIAVTLVREGRLAARNRRC